jgi:hypothetical protein
MRIREAASREERIKCNGGKLTEEKAFRVAEFLWVCPLPTILNIRKHNVSETEFVSVLR